MKINMKKIKHSQELGTLRTQRFGFDQKSSVVLMASSQCISNNTGQRKSQLSHFTKLTARANRVSLMLIKKSGQMKICLRITCTTHGSNLAESLMATWLNSKMLGSKAQRQLCMVQYLLTMGSI